MLTKRQLEIAFLVHKGYSNRVIANKLFLAEGTIKEYLYHVYDELHIKNRVDLALYVERNKQKLECELILRAKG